MRRTAILKNNNTAEKRRKEEAFALESIAHYCFVEIKSNCDDRFRVLLEFRFYVRSLPQNLNDRKVYEFPEAKAKVPTTWTLKTSSTRREQVKSLVNLACWNT